MNNKVSEGDGEGEMQEEIRETMRGKRRTRRRKKRRVLRFLLCVIVLVALLAGYARYVEPYVLLQREESYTSAKLVSAVSASAGSSADSKEPGDSNDSSHAGNASGGVKIAIFADTHFSEQYTPENFHRVVEEINEREPDLIFFLGDLVDDFSSYTGDIEEIEAELAALKAKFGKFAVYGNHDYGGEMQFDYPKVMDAGGFRLLVNEAETLEELNLTVMGIDDMVIGYGDPTAAAVLEAERCNIVLCHEPDVADELLGYPVDLMLSGHTHGRQINLWFFDDYILPNYGRKYIKGAYELDGAAGNPLKLYVTGGIGTTKIPMRFASPPEINFIELKGE